MRAGCHPLRATGVDDMCFGGDDETTTVIQPGRKSAQERALTAKQIELADQQLQSIADSRTFQNQAFEQFGPLVEAQQAEFERLQGRALAQEPIQDELQQIALENIRRGTAATPEQAAQIDAIRNAQLAQGESDISRFQGDATERLREELSTRLGLRPTDTPIVDRAGRVAAEAARQQGQLVRGLDQTAAQGKLNFPLAAQGLQSQQVQFQQGLGDAAERFQADLRNQAFSNRLALTGQQGGQGLQLATGIPGASSLGSAASIAAANRGQTTTTTGGGQGIGLGGILGGLGGLLGGIAQISDRRLKKDIRRIATSAAGLGIYAFKYLIGGPEMVGVMADELIGTKFADAVKEGPGGFKMVDYSLIDAPFQTLAAWEAA